MEAVQIRMTGEWCDLSGVINSLCDMSQKAIVFRHTEESKRPHYHVYLFGTGRKEDTIRNMIKKINWQQKEDWSLRTYAGSKKEKQPITVAGACKYGSKGKYDPVVVKEVTSEVIRVGKSLGFCKKDQVSESKETEDKVRMKPRLTKLDLVGLIDDEIRSSNNYDPDRVYSFSFYMEKVNTVITRERQFMPTYKAIELYEVWCQYHDRPTWMRDAVSLLERRYCR